MPAGAFELEEIQDQDDFTLRPKSQTDPVPEDQRDINSQVYEAANILKLLREKGIFRRSDPSYPEFVRRIKEAARAGCVDNQVQIKLAAQALEQIRKDVVRRKGRTIKYGYLVLLAFWAVLGAAVGFGVVFGAPYVYPNLAPYGYVIVGSMIGAWVSLAATRREISFDGIQDFLDFRFEPFVRMLFVASVACIVALFLDQGALSISLGKIDLAKFTTDQGCGLMLGVLAGLSERAVTVQILERTKKVFGSG